MHSELISCHRRFNYFYNLHLPKNVFAELDQNALKDDKELKAQVILRKIGIR